MQTLELLAHFATALRHLPRFGPWVPVFGPLQAVLGFICVLLPVKTNSKVCVPANDILSKVTHKHVPEEVWEASLATIIVLSGIFV